MILSRRLLLGMRKVSDKVCREINTCFISSTFFSENCDVYEIHTKKYATARHARDD
jgi:hypothetical protein